MASPLLGPAGNVEFLLHAKLWLPGEETGGLPDEHSLDVGAAIRQGDAVRSKQ
jgi:hypothetical protein